jgi:AAA+ superfamily predicted ATPase
MFGESGVGKTYAVKQYAQEMGANYTCIKYGDLGSPFKDAGSMKILNMFKNIANEASKNPNEKYVVCVDEIDALLRKVTEHGGRESSNARSSVLTGMDELVSKCKNVTVVATSNYHPESKLIDMASMRRFNAKIEVPLPNREQTEELLKMYLKGPKALKEDFFKSSEFKNFVDELVKGKYANGEIETIAKSAKDKFAVSIKDVPEAELEKHLFSMDFLREGKKLYGNAAAIANDTMKV